MEEKSSKKYALTEEGKKYMKEGLPERKLAELVLKVGTVKIEDAQKNIDNFSVALNWAKKNEWVVLEKGFLKPHRKIDAKHDNSLKDVNEGKHVDENIIRELISRRLVEEVKETELVRAKEQLRSGEISRLTPELIKTGLWREAKLRPYNVEACGKIIYPGKRHIKIGRASCRERV